MSNPKYATWIPAALNRRSLAVIAFDSLVAVLAFEAAVGIAYALRAEPQPVFFVWEGTALFLAASLAAYWVTGLYRGIWSYFSARDVITIVKAATAAIVIFLPAMFIATRLYLFPRTALPLAWLFLVAGLAGARFLFRAISEGSLKLPAGRSDDDLVPILVVGAGDEAEAFIRQQARQRQPKYRIVSIIDDNPARIGREIRGIRVEGPLSRVDQILEQNARRGVAVQRMAVSTGRVSGESLRELISFADRNGISVSRLPRIAELDRTAEAGDDVPSLRPIDIEDLLRRPQRRVIPDHLRDFIEGKVVAITGAGGSIGAELCRQIATFGPARLVLIDASERNLYEIDLDLRELFPALALRAALCDVRDEAALCRLFEDERPAIVFHAAALKHVPIAEANPAEIVRTNVLGTVNVANACEKAGVSIMTLISTDKAVNPTSLMGATKRVAELYCRARGAGKATRIVTVRFGNVLGSTGSVVPLFQRQIAQGGPVTVTHPDIERYFMTIREAVELVLVAATLVGEEEEAPGIFVLDMGRPVRIQDLARQMIRLSGLSPDRDVRIKYSGLRPGEKLYEELFYENEGKRETSAEGLLRATAPEVELGRIEKEIERLLAELDDEAAIRACLRHIVPEFNDDAAETKSGEMAARGRTQAAK